jgi:hypothetical protein
MRYVKGLELMKMSEETRTMSVPAAGRILGLSRNGAYEAARRGDLPTLRIGGRIFVVKDALDRMLAAAEARAAAGREGVGR